MGYFEGAGRKLDEEAKAGKFGTKAAAMKKAVKEALAKTILGDLEREKEKRKKEISGLTAFVGVGAALCAAGACWLAAPWWTAVAPLVLMVAVMRKAGWL